MLRIFFEVLNFLGLRQLDYLRGNYREFARVKSLRRRFRYLPLPNSGALPCS